MRELACAVVEARRREPNKFMPTPRATIVDAVVVAFRRFELLRISPLAFESAARLSAFAHPDRPILHPFDLFRLLGRLDDLARSQTRGASLRSLAVRAEDCDLACDFRDSLQPKAPLQPFGLDGFVLVPNVSVLLAGERRVGGPCPVQIAACDGRDGTPPGIYVGRIGAPCLEAVPR